MKKLLIAILLMLTSGCATTNTLQPGTGGTKFTVVGKTYNQVWKASVKVIAAQQLVIVEQNKETGVIKAEKGLGLTTWGEVVGVFISPANKVAKKYTVEVKSSKRLKTQATGQDWTQSIVAGIQAELGD